MKLARLFLLCTACAWFVACGDDPFTPGGPYVAPSYRASLESLSGSFYGVGGSGAGDVYAVGPAILHYNGDAWDPVEPPPGANQRLRYVLGFDSGELIVSNERDVFIRDNGSWTALPSPPDFFRDLEGSAPDDLWALSWDGLIHFDGTSWSIVPVPQPHEFEDIACNEAGVFVGVGVYGRVDRYDDGTWTTGHLDSMVFYLSVAVTTSGRTFVAGLGSIWEVVDSAPVLIMPDQGETTILRSDGETLYAFGRIPPYWNSHHLRRYSGGAWSDVSRDNGAFNDLWAGDGSIVGVGADAFLWQGNDSGGAALPLYSTRGEFEDAVAIGDAIYTIGYASYRYENDEWTNLDKEYITNQPASGIDGRSPGNIYAVGDNMILHYDGTAWSWVNGGLGSRLRAVWVEENGDVVAVGTDGDNPVMVEFDGTTWSKRPVPLGSYTFYDVCGVGNMVVTVGDGGLVGMRKGGHWYLLRATGATLTSVWGFDENHIYAASTNDNAIYFFDGYRWDSMPIDVPMDAMRSIWGTSPGNIFVLDDNGTLAHFDGTGWAAEERIFTERMYAVTGTRREVMTVGYYGSAIYRR